ncbi:MAG TPA: hypothetical protein VH302_00365 [Bryobacteraceae bacterium]|nr:hypothetical protein [Bryobacteraceae bacterium]
MCGQRAVVIALLAIPLFGQALVPIGQSRRMDVVLGEALEKQTLPCDAEQTKPFLDFAFRFEVGYVVRCPLKEFGGVETSLAAYTRVTGGNGNPLWFSEWYRVPGMPDDLRSRINLQRDHNDVEFRGTVAVGEGEYSLDVVVADRQHRLFHRNWKTKVFARGAETRAPVSLPPNEVAAVDCPDWRHTESAHNFHRLTVLVDAAPVDSSSTRLRAWDRAFLTEALSSVLTRLPSNSVRVVAFNLDQEQELFEADEFDAGETRRFLQSLEKLELGKVSYDVLRDAHGACNMLLDLLKRERAAKNAGDAVILLGPTNRLTERIPPEMVQDHRVSGPPVFYLKYSPVSPVRFRLPFSGMAMREDLGADMMNLTTGDNGEFPDIVQHAAALHDGVTINMHSPVDLADALKAIEHRLHPGGARVTE